MTEEELVDSLEIQLARLIGDLGAMKGVNDDAFRGASRALRGLREVWAGRTQLPRRAVIAMFGCVPIMLNASHRYGQAGESVVDKAAKLDELINECLLDSPRT